MDAWLNNLEMILDEDNENERYGEMLSHFHFFLNNEQYDFRWLVHVTFSLKDE